MNKRITIILSMLGLIMLSTVAVAQTPQPPAEGTHAKPGTPAPSVPPVPSVPSLPSVPSIPSVPSVPPIPNIDPLGDVMFPPDLIMRHSRELSLTSEQKAFLRSEIQRTTTRFNELQWQLQDAMELLLQTMKSTVVNNQQALSQLDKVLDVEREIKRLHVGLGIQIKNQLTEAQQGILQGMRKAPWPARQFTPARQE